MRDVIPDRWEVQFYPADNDWLVSDAPLEVFGTKTIGSFDTEDDARRFAAARNAWEKAKQPPRPEDFNGEKNYGRRCHVPGCGEHVDINNIKCGVHGGATADAS